MVLLKRELTFQQMGRLEEDFDHIYINLAVYWKIKSLFRFDSAVKNVLRSNFLNLEIFRINNSRTINFRH